MTYQPSQFLFAFDALDRGKAESSSIWLVMPLLCKENLGLSVAAFGLYAALARRRSRFGLSWGAIGTVVSLAATLWLIPAIREAPDANVPT